MEFQIIETLGLEDGTAVLKALERHLRSVTGIVERNGEQVVTFGMGRSPLGFRWEDQMLFRASAEDGRTTVTGLVRYEPDVFMDAKAQADRVRDLIEDTLERMRADLKVQRLQPTTVTFLDAGSEATIPPAATDTGQAGLTGEGVETKTEENLPGGGMLGVASKAELEGWREAARSAQIAYGFGLARRAAAARAEEAQAKTAAAEAAPERRQKLIGSKAPLGGAEIVAEAGVASGGAKTRNAEPKAIAQSVAPVARQAEAVRPREVREGELVVASSAVNPLGQMIALLRRKTRKDANPEKDDAGHATPDLDLSLLKTGWRVRERVIFAAMVVVAVSAMTAVSVGWHPWLSESPMASTPSFPAAAPVEPTATAAPSPSEVDKRLWVKPEKDLTLWAQDWAEALRSRNAESQGSYYSSRVQNYLGVQAASREFIIQNKMEGIKRRQHLSLVKVEHVRVEKQTNSEAVLRLVKHTITQTPSEGVSETFVQTRLKVVNQGGVWQIVDEQESNSDQATNRSSKENSSTPGSARPGVRGRRSV